MGWVTQHKADEVGNEWYGMSCMVRYIEFLDSTVHKGEDNYGGNSGLKDLGSW